MVKKYDAELKARVAVEAIKGQKTMAEISSEYKVHSTQIHNWKMQALKGLKTLFNGQADKEKMSHEESTQNLYAQIGLLKVENDFLKKAVYPH